MNRQENKESLENLYERLRLEFTQSERIMQVMAECIGGLRLTFPDLKDLHRAERNKRIKAEFTGFNYEELGNRYRLKKLQIRRILQGD